MPYTNLLHHDFNPGKSSIWRMRHDTHYEASLHVAAKLKMHGDDRAKAKARSEGRKEETLFHALALPLEHTRVAQEVAESFISRLLRGERENGVTPGQKRSSALPRLSPIKSEPNHCSKENPKDELSHHH
jgi:hypothetical protein